MPARPKAAAGADPAFSVFHEPWWFDAASPHPWQEIHIAPGDGVTATWRFQLRRRAGLLVADQPPLTRTLGPDLRSASGAPVTDFRRRQRLTAALVAELPKTHLFQQVLDPRITEAVAFRICGFHVHAGHTFQIEPTRAETEVWKRMTDKTRNAIRRAAEQLDVADIDDPDRFCDFYEGNLKASGRANTYASDTMRRLLRATTEHHAGCLLGASQAGSDLAAAIALVWDAETTYFLLSTRCQSAHSGAVGLLLWHAIRRSLQERRGFDFDGVASASNLHFLAGFGGTLRTRLVIERSSLLYDTARFARRVLRGGQDTLGQI